MIWLTTQQHQASQRENAEKPTLASRQSNKQTNVKQTNKQTNKHNVRKSQFKKWREKSA
jgi:hypothetical protein